MSAKHTPTLEELEAIPRNTLKTAEAASFLGMSPNTLNCAAKAGTLPFACKAGTETIIPKNGFIHWVKFGTVVVRVERPSETKNVEGIVSVNLEK